MAQPPHVPPEFLRALDEPRLLTDYHYIRDLLRSLPPHLRFNFLRHCQLRFNNRALELLYRVFQSHFMPEGFEHELIEVVIRRHFELRADHMNRAIGLEIRQFDGEGMRDEGFMYGEVGGEVLSPLDLHEAFFVEHRHPIVIPEPVSLPVLPPPLPPPPPPPPPPPYVDPDSPP
eukprot:PhF_6_TR40915/c1_g1_i1/m.61891